MELELFTLLNTSSSILKLNSKKDYKDSFFLTELWWNVDRNTGQRLVTVIVHTSYLGGMNALSKDECPHPLHLPQVSFNQRVQEEVDVVEHAL